MLVSPLSIAPMIDWTHTYFRQFMRILCCDVLLYTEMITTGAIEHQPDKSLELDLSEHPVAIQLGGSDRRALAECAVKAEKAGFVEINLNVGCPSDRVLSGRMGACLMAEPNTVADAVSAMKEAVSIPVTVKTRIGIDNFDDYSFLSDFVASQIQAGVDKLIVHARKAWLKGLSPKENRTIPPINYDFVYRLKNDFPELIVVINGDIKSLHDINHHLRHVDGVMLGRLACDNPFKIHQIASSLFNRQESLSRSDAFHSYISVIESGFKKRTPLSILTKPIMNLCYGISGSKLWKKALMNMVHSKSIAHLSRLETLILQLERQEHGKMVEYLVH